ncbi:MAG: hypothetical protein JOY86_04535 [Candidatus Eremiobacteraeota bacterium]|nr:hypothetical protein [Candidatus Eremiobacteraeota bacterium]
MRTRIVLAVACIALAAAGCSQNQQQSSTPQASGAATTAPANTTGLPLPANASVIDARDLHQTVNPSQEKGSAFQSLAQGTYVGHEVVASTPATVEDLDKWLATVAPPEGYKAVNSSSSISQAVHKYGISYVAFVSGNNKGATIVVMDPKTVSTKLGPVLAVLDRYNAMPAQLKAGMDAQVKARTGQSISEMMDKSAPLGATVSALNDFRNSDNRAIILISAEKQ